MGLILLGGVAVLDYVTGPELSFSLFYLIPISIVSWAVGRKIGIITAILSAGIWLIIEVISGVKYSNAFIYLWNTIIRLGFFALSVFAIRLSRTVERERMYARTDPLTGVFNIRFFQSVARTEIDRSARYDHPFTIAFVDLDNFKRINDTYGHTVGDNVLRIIADTMKNHLRKTDIIARMGGDEFVILLPEIGSETAPVIMANVQHQLTEEMKLRNWNVTFSIGVLSLTAPELSVDQILSMADRMMYTVKNSGKNNIRYASYPLKATEMEK